MRLSGESIARAFLDACRAELDAPKPGNVHRFAPGHGMEIAHFEASAEASAPLLAETGARVGTRILGATRATWAAVGMNTNLGILLLCAPIAAAAEQLRPELSRRRAPRALREAIAAVLADLDGEDARLAFEAIALASPGGLGEEDEHDVRRPPAIGLVEAMRIAASRDLVGRQYAQGFADVFETGLAAIHAARADGETEPWLAVRCFLAFASAFPDSHIVRKYGIETAVKVRERMRLIAKTLEAQDNREEALLRLLDFDREFKADGINPGTSADLAVAALFADRLLENLAQ